MAQESRQAGASGKKIEAPPYISAESLEESRRMIAAFISANLALEDPLTAHQLSFLKAAARSRRVSPLRICSGDMIVPPWGLANRRRGYWVSFHIGHRLFWLLYLPFMLIIAGRRLDMREWDFWMWLAYGLLTIAATLLAADQGIKLAPELAGQLSWLTNKNWWAFSPIVFVVTATIVFLLHDFGVIGSITRLKQPPSQFIDWPTPYTPASITGKTFKNQIVVLDGASYSECNFYNVTFRYNGTTAIQLINNKIYGSISYTSDNRPINDTFLMLRGVGMLSDNAPAKVTP